MQNFNSQQDFFQYLLKVTLQNDDDTQLYALLQANLHWLNEDFAYLLKNWINPVFAMPEEFPGDNKMIAFMFAGRVFRLSGLMQNFSQGNKASNVEIAIAGYESILRVYTEEDFPELWADTQVNMGRAYSQRIKGGKADNIEQEILCLQNALRVFTLESSKDNWLLAINNLGCTYASLAEIHHGDKNENVAKAISYFQQVLDNNPSSAQKTMTIENLMGTLMSEEDSLDFKIQKANAIYKDYANT